MNDAAAASNAVGMAQKLLLFWRKPARRCWWEGVELENVEGVGAKKLKVWIRRVWTLEMVRLILLYLLHSEFWVFPLYYGFRALQLGCGHPFSLRRSDCCCLCTNNLSPEPFHFGASSFPLMMTLPFHLYHSARLQKHLRHYLVNSLTIIAPTERHRTTLKLERTATSKETDGKGAKIGYNGGESWKDEWRNFFSYGGEKAILTGNKLENGGGAVEIIQR